jgi:hypothetical protein
MAETLKNVIAVLGIVATIIFLLCECFSDD